MLILNFNQLLNINVSSSIFFFLFMNTFFCFESLAKTLKSLSETLDKVVINVQDQQLFFRNKTLKIKLLSHETLTIFYMNN